MLLSSRFSTGVVHALRSAERRSHDRQSRGHRSLLCVAACFALTLTVGCGKTGPTQTPVFPVKGSISFHGYPIQGAIVALHPKGGPKEGVPTPRASVDHEGKFAVTTYKANDGAPEGEYVVTVTWYKPLKQGADLAPGPNALPVKLSKPDTSNLTAKVAAQPTELPPIKL